MVDWRMNATKHIISLALRSIIMDGWPHQKLMIIPDPGLILSACDFRIWTAPPPTNKDTSLWLFCWSNCSDDTIWGHFFFTYPHAQVSENLKTCSLPWAGVLFEQAFHWSEYRIVLTKNPWHKNDQVSITFPPECAISVMLWFWGQRSRCHVTLFST